MAKSKRQFAQIAFFERQVSVSPGNHADTTIVPYEPYENISESKWNAAIRAIKKQDFYAVLIQFFRSYAHEARPR